MRLFLFGQNPETLARYINACRACIGVDHACIELAMDGVNDKASLEALETGHEK